MGDGLPVHETEATDGGSGERGPSIMKTVRIAFSNDKESIQYPEIT